VNFAIRPRGTKDLNIVDKHRRESILVHANKGCSEGAAVRKDRSLGGEGVDAVIIINGGDADEARSVATAGHHRGIIGCPPLCLSGTTSLQGQTLTNKHAD
jgi:hypothetical protein